MTPRRTGSGSSDLTVVVLAGGGSRRFGADKLAAPLRGSTVLDVLLVA
ncbi:MAG: NTP transferase domain-containing protein, partial [Dermatophilaceae bacterium]